MKKPGFKRTGRPGLKGHQDCGDCHPPLKSGQKRERRKAREEIREYV